MVDDRDGGLTGHVADDGSDSACVYDNEGFTPAFSCHREAAEGRGAADFG